MFWQPPKNDNCTRKSQILIHPLVSFYRRTGKTRKYFWQKIFSSKKFRLLAKKVCFFYIWILFLNVGQYLLYVLYCISECNIWRIFLSFDRMGVLRLIWMVRKSVAFCPKNSFFVLQWNSGVSGVKSTIGQSEFSSNCFSLLIEVFHIWFLVEFTPDSQLGKKRGVGVFIDKKNL